jgi:hypothetical protein
MTRGDACQLLDRAGPTPQMDPDDSGRARRDGSFNAARIQTVRRGIDVGEYRR